jgi:hypothetical protein
VNQTTHPLVPTLTRMRDEQRTRELDLIRMGYDPSVAAERSWIEYGSSIDNLTQQIAYDMSVLPQYAPRMVIP